MGTPCVPWVLLAFRVVPARYVFIVVLVGVPGVCVGLFGERHVVVRCWDVALSVCVWCQDVAGLVPVPKISWSRTLCHWFMRYGNFKKPPWRHLCV